MATYLFVTTITINAYGDEYDCRVEGVVPEIGVVFELTLPAMYATPDEARAAVEGATFILTCDREKIKKDESKLGIPEEAKP